MINTVNTRRKGCHSAVCCCSHYFVAWEGLGDFLHLQAPQWGLVGSPLIRQATKAQMLHQVQRAFLPTDKHEISQPSPMNFFVLAEKSDLKVQCLLARPSPPPCNPYVKLDCEAVGSTVPWDNLQLIILSEGGSLWKKTPMSLRHLQSFGGYLDFACTVVSPRRAFYAFGTS